MPDVKRPGWVFEPAYKDEAWKAADSAYENDHRLLRWAIEDALDSRVEVPLREHVATLLFDWIDTGTPPPPKEIDKVKNYMVNRLADRMRSDAEVKQ